MSRRKWIALSMAAFLGVSAFAGSFAWTAGASDDDWDSCNNWLIIAFGPECYPSSDTLDNARIPYGASGYDVNLINEDIKDFTIAGDARFASAGGTPTLTVRSFKIEAGGNGAEVSISGATIETR